MKKNVTYISSLAILSLVEASGCTVAEKAGWYKVMGAKGRRLYVPKTKSVGRIDLVGIPDGEGIRALGGDSFGSVTHQVDFSRTEPEILSTVAHCLEQLAQLPELEVTRKPRAAKAEPEPASLPSLADRLALIARVAKEKGVPMSASLLAADEGEEIATSEDVELLPDAE